MTTVYGGHDTSTSNAAETEIYESALLTANYFLGKGLFRPFLGASIGDFSTSYYMGSNINKTGNRRSSNVGEMIRLGFEIDHFWFDMESNTIPPL